MLNFNISDADAALVVLALIVSAAYSAFGGPLRDIGWRKRVTADLDLAERFERSGKASYESEVASILRKRAALRAIRASGRFESATMGVSGFFYGVATTAVVVLMASCVFIIILVWTSGVPEWLALVFATSALVSLLSMVAHKILLGAVKKREKDLEDLDKRSMDRQVERMFREIMSTPTIGDLSDAGDGRKKEGPKKGDGESDKESSDES